MTQENSQKIAGGSMNLLNIEGLWLILKLLQADLELMQLGSKVSGKYHNAEVNGTIDGTLLMESEGVIITGKWADQLGAGDFRIAVGNVGIDWGSAAERMLFHGNWRHSASQHWDGIFEGEKM
jgi:hypothetical protein